MADNVNNEMNYASEAADVKVNKVKPAKETAVVKSTSNKPKKTKRGISYEKKQGFVGFMFTLPWLIGFIMFFFAPAIKSIQFSFSDIAIFENYKTTWNNFQNYVEVFTNEYAGESFKNMFIFLFFDLVFALIPPLLFAFFLTIMRSRGYSALTRTF